MGLSPGDFYPFFDAMPSDTLESSRASRVKSKRSAGFGLEESDQRNCSNAGSLWVSANSRAVEA